MVPPSKAMVPPSKAMLPPPLKFPGRPACNAASTLETLLYGGEYCTVSHDCISCNCSNNKCTGPAKSAPIPKIIAPPSKAMVPPSKAMVPPSKAMVPPSKAMVPPSKAMVPPSKAMVPPSKAMIPPSKAMTPQGKPMTPKKPMTPQGKPMTPKKPMTPQGKPMTPKKPMSPQGKPMTPHGKPITPYGKPTDSHMEYTGYVPASQMITEQGSLCNAQTIISDMNKSIDNYNALFDGISNLQKNMQTKLVNKLGNNDCGCGVEDMACNNNSFEQSNLGQINLIDDANLQYSDFLKNNNRTNMLSPTSYSAYTPTNSGITTLLNNANIGTGNLLTGVGAGTGNLLTGVGAGTGNALTSVGAGTGNLLTGVGAGTGNALTSVGAGTGNLLTSVGAGTGNLLSSVGAGTGNALTSVGAGTGNLLTDVGAGTGNLLTLNNTGGVISTGAMQNTDFRSVPTGITGPLNPLTYNGALVEKPTSNFMPLTTDFSKFGR